MGPSGAMGKPKNTSVLIWVVSEFWAGAGPDLSNGYYLGPPVGQSVYHIGAIRSGVAVKLFHHFIQSVTRGYREEAQVVCQPGFLRCNEIRQRVVHLALAFIHLLS